MTKAKNKEDYPVHLLEAHSQLQRVSNFYFVSKYLAKQLDLCVFDVLVYVIEIVISHLTMCTCSLAPGVLVIVFYLILNLCIYLLGRIKNSG